MALLFALEYVFDDTWAPERVILQQVCKDFHRAFPSLFVKYEAKCVWTKYIASTDSVSLLEEYKDCVDWQWINDHHYPAFVRWCYADRTRHDLVSKRSVLRIACQTGDIELFDWAWYGGAMWESVFYCEAAKMGQLGVMKYAHQFGCEWMSSRKRQLFDDMHFMESLYFAVERQDMEMIQWLGSVSGNKLWKSHAWLRAVALGATKIAEQLSEDDDDCTLVLSGSVFRTILEYSPAESISEPLCHGLKWVYERMGMKMFSLPVDTMLAKELAGRGDYLTLEWLESVGVTTPGSFAPLPRMTLRKYTPDDPVLTAKWITPHKCLPLALRKLLEQAIELNKCQIATYLISQHDVWDSRAYENMVYCNRLGLLKTVHAMKKHELESHWSPGRLCLTAIGMANVEILEWLRAQNCAWPVSWPTDLHRLEGAKAIVWLVDHGYPLTSQFSSALMPAHIKCAKWVVLDKKCPIKRLWLTAPFPETSEHLVVCLRRNYTKIVFEDDDSIVTVPAPEPGTTRCTLLKDLFSTCSTCTTTIITVPFEFDMNPHDQAYPYSHVHRCC